MRTIAEIEAALVNTQPGLSTSASAEWRGWVSIFAYAIWLFEGVMDVFKADVESQLQRKQPGTLEWYSEKALAFQNGDTLRADEWGVVGYALVDQSKQIVKHASVAETDGTLILKVATIDTETGELEPLNLTTGEFLNFQRYMESVKFAGTAIEYRTLPADEVIYGIDVYYDPLYLPATVQVAIEAKLQAFRTEISFNARLYKSDFVNAILSVEGVKTVKVTAMIVTPSEGDPIALDVFLELESGYFNFSEESVINMINVNA